MKTYIIIFLLSSLSLTAQNPVVEWTKTFGGGYVDYPFSIIITKDNKYVLGGHSFWGVNSSSVNNDFDRSKGGNDAWLVKLDEDGSVLWKKNYGGSQHEGIWSLCQTSDNGIIILASTNSSDGDITTVNRGNGDIWLIKTDSLGTIEWQKTIGGSGIERGQTIIQLSNGDYLLGLRSESNDWDLPYNRGKTDIWVIKLNPQGDVIWKKNIGGSEDEDEIAQIVQIDDKTVAIAGSTHSSDGDMVGVLGDFSMKMDTSGKILWTKSFGYYNDTISGLRYLYAATKYKQDLVFAGMRIVPNLSPDAPLPYSWHYLITRSDTAGNRKWSKLYGGSDSDIANGVHPLPNGDLIVTGYTQSKDSIAQGNHGALDFFVLRLDSLGNLKNADCFGGTKSDQVFSSAVDKKGNVLVVGSSDSSDGHFPQNKGSLDWAIIKLNYGLTATEETVAEAANLIVYPNPVSDELTIRVKSGIKPNVQLYDVTGKLMYQKSNLDATSTIDISSLPNGFYILSCQLGQKYVCRKIVKQ